MPFIRKEAYIFLNKTLDDLCYNARYELMKNKGQIKELAKKQRELKERLNAVNILRRHLVDKNRKEE